MKSKTTIELNGKRYDAVTGTVIGVASAPPVRTGRNIDGFFRARTSAPKTVAVAQKITTLTAPAPVYKPHNQPQRTVNHAQAHAPQQATRMAAARKSDIAHHSKPLAVHRSQVAANHTKHRAPQSSMTLMRESVHRPAPSLLKQLGTQGTLQHSVPSLIVPKQSVASIDPIRLVRAQTATRSPHISHHSTHSHAVQPIFTPLAVQPTPTTKPGSEEPAAPSPQPTNKPTDIFEHALANASHFVDVQAHTRHFKKQARHHITSMAAGTLALVVIAGFAAYQNTPGLQFKLASVQAGVSTGMPNFQAAGFAYNGVKASDGKLTVGFSNVSGNYQLVQQTTNLSGEDVIQDIGATDASGTPDYRTVQANGTTIYRFGNTDATWVAGGKWYSVTGTGALTDTQVKSLVHNI